MKLLVMGCSATKRPNTGQMASIDRYDGPMWRTLRARLRNMPRLYASVRSGDIRIIVLSAQFGFIDAIETKIGDYDRRMTPQRAAELCRLSTSGHHDFAQLFKQADDVLFAAGGIYRDAMWRASGGTLADIMKVTETDGGGIVVHRMQLGAWLDLHFGPTAMERAA